MDSDLQAKVPELKEANTVPVSQGNSTNENAARLPVNVSLLFKLHQLSDSHILLLMMCAKFH